MSYNTAEVAFARKPSLAKQWKVVLPPEFTGRQEDILLAFDPLLVGKPNSALFEYRDGDRYGKPLALASTRLNEAPQGSAPSLWIDFKDLPLVLWYKHDPAGDSFYSVQLSKGALAGVRDYEF